MSKAKEPLIRTATFNPRVCSYWLWSSVIVLTLTIIGIPFLLIWIPLGLLFTRRYLERISCDLTARNLQVRKGFFVRVEKTIPLEKITDLGMVQGPIMRYFGIHQLTVETAGQSGDGALVSLTGINDVEDFREAVLTQRDYHRETVEEKPAPARDGPRKETDALLTDIRDALLRIEKSLESHTKTSND